jgi:hypothetical protein
MITWQICAGLAILESSVICAYLIESTAPSAARKYGSAYYRSLLASALSISILAA